MAHQDRSFSAFADSEIDGSGAARYQRDKRWLVALPDDPHYLVTSLEGHLLDVSFAGLANPKPVQPEQHRESGVGMVEPLGGEEEPAELAAVQPTPLRRMDLRAANVLGRVGLDPTVDVGEAVEATRRRQAAVLPAPRSTIEVRYNSRWVRVASSTAMLWSAAHWNRLRRSWRVGVEYPAAVAGQECHGGQLGLVGWERPDSRVQFSREVKGCHL